MRKYLLAAVAAAAIASPAAARDGSGYVGADLGALFPLQRQADADLDFANTATSAPLCLRQARIRYKTGYDGDLNAGYDLGMFRVEGELGYKRASHHRVFVTD